MGWEGALSGDGVSRDREVCRGNERDAVRDCIRGYGFFLSFRDEIVEAYDGLFSTTSGEGGVVGGAEAAFAERYGWYQSLYALAGGDALRLSDATSLQIHEALTWLQFEKEKNKLESDRIKKAYKK